ncbi:MAG: nucleotidyltransferase [Candidatus Raymondbacteria bacterium RifOxyA12_full_50_37]|uniref:Nucleotidyltransferase n=1 Tax=Candidatus Raymondbacteria bacterium RIFOXYD12_FULL_49_13 TaxID=1817890 RepID=A0A1F7F9C1_UNCRA|nr:MAG: nucleotidyltransferase [Candidatus Raymondbacteria bacterium RIFOXYA2_FULL_49_16]OGJ90755.1 MAG: nucleotidyltransferase [Candidatus Raymondbacteria bacterium RifOxyA12_full_50_37]OGJ92947.1 MAG: nucleotidyltransferase [Candidatus Raymondbacteria bacterium RifOxyB12_full_50_8]OGJ98392.1 MAG: nucleotidyltransferase [Candidatus Raymondbacteria bacterium RIFOXYC2_FULL_50_21]OGK03116.1 MAG: nucleotidyltransferase [Candidatus Raymondbacteria bacterium RIFOXYD12_FULL_49_13]OGK06598.1 MAG: nuc
MDKETALNILRRFKASLEAHGVIVARMVLFGSYAAGTQTEGSDIDVVVVSNSFRKLNHWQRIELMSKALYEVFEPIETRALTTEEWENNSLLTVQYAKSGALITV